jgi:hypothetical protein
VGPRRGRDVRLRRLLGDRLAGDAVHRAAADHQPDGGGRPGRRGRPSYRHGRRRARAHVVPADVRDAAVAAEPDIARGIRGAPGAAAADPPSLLSLLGGLTGPFSPLALVNPALGGYLFSAEPYGLASVSSAVAQLSQQVSALPSAGGAGLLQGGLASGTRLVGSPAGVSGDIGHAGSLGRLSVPQGWAAAAPAIKPLATVLPQLGLGADAPAIVAADNQGGLFSNMAVSSLAGRAMAGTGGTAAGCSGAYSGRATTPIIIVIAPDD